MGASAYATPPHHHHQQQQPTPRKSLTIAPIYPSAYRPHGPAMPNHGHGHQPGATYLASPLGPGGMPPQPLQPPLPQPLPPPHHQQHPHPHHQQQHHQQQQQHVIKEDHKARP